jgi:uncharacterized membrane protein YcaP (DUF421 family)
MFTWMLGSWRSVGYVALSAVLIYASTVLALRCFGERRTLTQMTIFDFAVAVAIGAIIARTATTPSPSYAQGITAVVALLLTHNGISAVRMRYSRSRKLFGRDPVVLVVDGKVREEALRSTHVTRDDLHTALRERGIASLAEVHLAILESRGAFSVLRSERADAALWPESPPDPHDPSLLPVPSHEDGDRDRGRTAEGDDESETRRPDRPGRQHA